MTTLMNSDGNDSLVGGTGNDSIVATGGDDTLEGGAGQDTLFGGADNDSLVGGAGDDSLDGGTGDDTLIGDARGIDAVTLSIGGSDRAGINPKFEVYADGALVHTGEVTWAQDGTATFDPGAPGAFQDVVVALPSGAPAAIEVRFINDFEAGDGGTPGDRNLHLDKITVGDTVYEAETDATVSGAAVSASDVNLFGTGSSATFDTTGAAPVSGDDTMSGGDGRDTFLVSDNFGNDVITGGEGGADEDTIDLSGMTGPVTVTYDGPESGTITDGIDTISFSEIERIILTDHDDSVDGRADTAGLDIDAGTGADTIEDGSGNDTILGGEGADSIEASLGDDSIDAGDGDDVLRFDDWDGDIGTNTVTGGAGYDELDLGAFNYLGEAGFSGTITDAGFSFANGTGSVTGDSIERFEFTYGGDTIDASATTDGYAYFLRDGSYNGVNDDVLVAGSGDDTIISADGHATLTGGAGNDSFSAINGDKTYLFEDGFGNDTVDSSTGTDRLDFSGLSTQNVTISMTDGANGTVTSGSDSALLSGGTRAFEEFALSDQADSFDATGSADGVTVEGGAGADTITGGSDDDSFEGDDGADSLTGGAGNDTLLGGAGDDTLKGGAGNDQLTGGTGADTFVVEDGFGSDTITGGDDVDTLDLSGLTGPVTVSYTGPGAGTATDGTDTLSFSGIERVILTDGADTLDGTNDSAGIDAEAGDGDDSVIGGSGNDTIDGGIGADTIMTGGGDDEIQGGDGDDSLAGNTGDDTIFGGDGDDQIAAGWALGGSGDSAASYNELDGGAGNDTISGSVGTDLAHGGDDNDFIEGYQGDDTLDGGAGDDTLRGGIGSDSITGGTGDDRLAGGDDDDIFTYGVGDGADTITDFNFGNSGALRDGDETNNDFIDLSGFYDNIGELRDDFDDDGVLNQSNTTGPDAANYSDNTQFATGDSLTFQGATAGDLTTDNTGVICFTEGTLIATPRGQIPIEALRIGDLVQTRDNGLRPIRWIGRRDLDQRALERAPHLKPIFVAPELIGAEAPLLLSPQHGVLLKHDGEELLIRAKHLVSLRGGKARVAQGRRRVAYIHILFDAHEIVFANGAPAESFYPGPQALRSLSHAALGELFELFPDLGERGAEAVVGAHSRRFARRATLPDHLGALACA